MIQTEETHFQNDRFSRVKGKTPGSSCSPTFLNHITLQTGTISMFFSSGPASEGSEEAEEEGVGKKEPG